MTTWREDLDHLVISFPGQCQSNSRTKASLVSVESELSELQLIQMPKVEDMDQGLLNSWSNIMREHLLILTISTQMRSKKWKIVQSKLIPNLKRNYLMKNWSLKNIFHQFCRSCLKENQLLFTILERHLVLRRNYSNFGERTSSYQSTCDRQLMILRVNILVLWSDPLIWTTTRYSSLIVFNRWILLKLKGSLPLKSLLGSVLISVISREDFSIFLVLNSDLSLVP